ncbi:ALPHA- 13 -FUCOSYLTRANSFERASE [Salix purpurea]|uniref:Fucosyltransferase n=1 Tax=Salix purpurea TaxID=77065 RepID=A0A9Q1ACK4_SALPP|nr:ALPHA- 13 -FUCOSYLTRANSFERASE [Salix purpurea]
MESTSYYAENNIAQARRMGFNVVMTTSLSSDVPVGCFHFQLCAHNFRLQALNMLEKFIKIGSYGSCHQNHDGKVDKDYVIEKFFQSLVAGTIPVVIGAPNIQDFAPAHNSILHIKELEDVDSIAKTMKYLGENLHAYNQSLRWKYEGPSDSFKALVDMAAVHSSCRLCIQFATMIQEKEETGPGFKRRPCRCTRGSQRLYIIYM